MEVRRILKQIYLQAYRYGLFNCVPDRFFVPFQYRMATGSRLNLNRVNTFNEKIQWMKLFDRNPLYPMLVDKYRVRQFVSERIGSEYLIPLLGHWDSIDDVNIDSLPDQFVIKCNHDSGGISICKDKALYDWTNEKKNLENHIKHNHYYLSREWAYKDVVPCFIAEKYLHDEESMDLRDYKFFCFNGLPKYIQVDYDRFSNHKRNIYDVEWNYVDLSIKCPNDSEHKIEKPYCLEEMLEIARKLSNELPQVRVDLYLVNGKIYFGEMTLYHGSGFEKFIPEQYGLEFGSYIDLSLCKTEGSVL